MTEPGSEEVDAILNCIDSDIESILASMTDDYLWVCGALKSHFARSGKVSHDYTSVVYELQYHDAYRQKMQHIKSIHGWIVRDGKPKMMTEGDNSRNLIRLNRLQFQVAASEYLSSMNAIHSICRAMLIEPELTSEVQARIIQNSDSILSQTQAVSSKFVKAELYALQSRRDISLSSYSLAIDGLYSSQGERGVLTAYMEKPHIEGDEIVVSPKDSNRNSTIDLF